MYNYAFDNTNRMFILASSSNSPQISNVRDLWATNDLFKTINYEHLPSDTRHVYRQQADFKTTNITFHDNLSELL